ncbi:MAG: hypothetical protein MMC33_001201 [Icmadophila ericetorum]|nr:hypothetical protein [Icmadophila ericetorum]
MENHPMRPTFGIEMECNIRYVRAEIDWSLFKEQEMYQVWKDHSFMPMKKKSEWAIRSLLYEVLTKEGIETNKPPIEKGYDRWTIEEDGSIEPVELDGKKAPGFRYFDTGIISRVLNVDKEGLSEVRKAISIINKTFTVVTNKSTGLHVHIGNRKNGFTFLTLRRFSQLVTAFEHLIRFIIAEWRWNEARVLWDDESVTMFCKEVSAPGKGLPLAAVDVFERLQLLEGANTEEALFDLMSHGGGRDYAYNFSNLRSWRNSSKKTIEFRQHEGTYNA